MKKMKYFFLALTISGLLLWPIKHTLATPIPIAEEYFIGEIPDGSTFRPYQFSAITDFENGTVHFQITFNRTPDFYTVDEYGRQAEAFQFKIDTDGVWPWPPIPEKETMEILIRGPEIHYSGDIRVRDDEPPVSDPAAGGWGQLRGSVPYTLDDLTLTFVTPLDLINDSDGWFSYELLFTEYGGGGSWFYGVCNVNYVPEPATMLLLGFGLLGLAGFRRKFRKG